MRRPVVGVIGNPHMVNDLYRAQLVGRRNLAAIATVADALPLMFAGAPDVTDILTPELRAVLTSVAPVVVPGALRGVGRNLPLILILALIGFVISRFAETSGPAAKQGDETPGTPPDGDPAVSAATSAAAAAAAA